MTSISGIIARIDKDLKNEIKRIQKIIYETDGYEVSFREASKIIADFLKDIKEEEFNLFIKKKSDFPL